MLALEAMLELAATIDGWAHVVHRCAWCQRVADEQGEYRLTTPIDPDRPTTHGMCPACAADLLQALKRRAASFRAATQSLRGD